MNNAQQASKQSRTKAARIPNERLKAQRLKKNWTQVYVATMIGTSDIEVSRWETGVSIPTLYFRERLCELFGKTPEDLGFISSTSETRPEERVLRPADELPLPLTRLIGREQEVAAVCALQRQTEVRLLTLTGPGGVGKTRLALHIASEVEHDFTGGVCFVSLAPLHDAELVLPTIIHTLRLQNIGTQTPLEYLKAALRKHHLLLLLDNFEQVAAAAPSLVELLSACLHLKIMVTSRAVLHVRGERTFPVWPLRLPDPLHPAVNEVVARAGAVALFVERAREIHPDFALTQETAPLVADICRRLDGLPLAIELAAARLKLFSLAVLKVRLEHRLQLLTGGPQDLPERQQTLRNTLQWSYDLLSEPEQRLFRVLSVFAGGCTLEAVEGVSCQLPRMEDVSLLDGIASLLDKHMLYQAVQGSEETGERRLFMLETIREYGLECLSAYGEMELTRRAHAQYYVRLAEEAETHLFGAEQMRWLDLLERERDNLRTALGWTVEQPDGALDEEAMFKRETALRLAAALVHFSVVYWSIDEGRAWLERALANSEGTPVLVRIKALSGAGWLAFHQSDMGQAEMLFEQCLRLYQEAQEARYAPGMMSAMPWLISWLALQRDNNPLARSLLEESRVYAREIGDKRTFAYLLLFLGLVAIEQGDYAEARSSLEESLALFKEMQNYEDIVWACFHLGRVLFAQGEEAQASSLIREGLAVAEDTNYKIASAIGFYLLGRFAFVQGDVTKARSHLEESLGLFRAVGEQHRAAHVLFYLARVALLEGSEAEACTLCKDSVALFRQEHDIEGIVYCLQGFGGTVAKQGKSVWAARLWGAVASLLGTGKPHPPLLLPFERTSAERADYERMVNAVRTQLGEKAFAKAWAEGYKTTPEQALAMQEQPVLLDQPHTSQKMHSRQDRMPPPPPGLTEREGEVLRLVAQGLSNAQVAEALVISPRTVDAHLRSIYSKLNLPSRHAAMHYAHEHHLV
jgi:predicted ATPase/DNA-binding CsgD family transcriptional regulator/DNA-binding XRE family transcriptional regulator